MLKNPTEFLHSSAYLCMVDLTMSQSVSPSASFSHKHKCHHALANTGQAGQADELDGG